MAERDKTSIPFTAHSFQEYLNEGKLMASRCVDCQGIYLPVRGLCPTCAETNLEWVELAGEGTLAAYTAIYVGPSFMNSAGHGRENPYLTGVVELIDGPRISARLLGLDAANPAEIKIGTRLAFATVPIGEGDDSYAQLAFQVKAE